MLRLREAEAACQRPPHSVCLIAASKTRTPDEIRAAYALGVRHFGENYLQEALAKQDALTDLDDIVWHFIGACQSRKAGTVARHFGWLHSLDRTSLVNRLASQQLTSPLNVCVQVNISAEPQKAGVDVAELPALLDAARQAGALHLRGLMAIPAPGDTDALARVARLFADHAGENEHWDTLSMGMSDDLEVAVAAGATHVRIGTAIFGPRKRG